jgi:hypothetical protein
MDPLIAELTLAEIHAVQVDNRRRTAALRFPVAAIGVSTFLAALVALLWGREHVAVFYAPALVVTAAAAALRYRRIAGRAGLQVSVAPWVMTAIALLALSATVARIGHAAGDRYLELAGPSLVFAAGYLFLARWGGNRTLALAAVAMMIDSTLAPAVVNGDACVAWQLAFNAVLLLAAAALTRPVGTT